MYDRLPEQRAGLWLGVQQLLSAHLRLPGKLLPLYVGVRSFELDELRLHGSRLHGPLSLLGQQALRE
jgi:hypothetical protein